jgi:hypothetical protein
MRGKEIVEKFKIQMTGMQSGIPSEVCDRSIRFQHHCAPDSFSNNLSTGEST